MRKIIAVVGGAAVLVTLSLSQPANAASRTRTVDAQRPIGVNLLGSDTREANVLQRGHLMISANLVNEDPTFQSVMDQRMALQGQRHFVARAYSLRDEIDGNNLVAADPSVQLKIQVMQKAAQHRHFQARAYALTYDDLSGPKLQLVGQSLAPEVKADPQVNP